MFVNATNQKRFAIDTELTVNDLYLSETNPVTF